MLLIRTSGFVLSACHNEHCVCVNVYCYCDYGTYVSTMTENKFPPFGCVVIKESVNRNPLRLENPDRDGKQHSGPRAKQANKSATMYTVTTKYEQ